MNSFWNLVKRIPLSNFLLKTPYQEVLENLDNHEKGILTKNSKLFLSSLFGWGISLFSTQARTCWNGSTGTITVLRQENMA